MSEPNFYFWCGWKVFDEIPNEWCLQKWPTNIKIWETASGENYTTWVARVTSSNAKEAWKTVSSCYLGSKKYVKARWEPYEYDGLPRKRFPE